MKLEQFIRNEIAQSDKSAIPFARFMELALYHPSYGYYTSDRPKVGKEGDFFTSATVHTVFAETLADVVIEMWDKNRIAAPTLVEIGGGTGHLLADMVERIAQTAPELHRELSLLLVEASPYHRVLQAEALKTFTGKKSWYSSIEEAAQVESIEGVVISNEWLDAFPVHLLEKRREGWREVWVTWTEGSGFVEKISEVTQEIEAWLQKEEPVVVVGMRIEVNLGMRPAVEAVARLLRRGYVITIDYGDEQEELYHPSRKRGTLMCYHRHQANENPYVRIGEQDITAHVDFSALSSWGGAVGLEPLVLLRQDQFLIKSGILEKAVSHQDRDPFTSQAMKRNRAIQQLIYSGGMGGVFRVLVQAKGVPTDLSLRFLQNKKDAQR